jgi:hypothetical protein
MTQANSTGRVWHLRRPLLKFGGLLAFPTSLAGSAPSSQRLSANTHLPVDVAKAAGGNDVIAQVAGRAHNLVDGPPQKSAHISAVCRRGEQ